MNLETLTLPAIVAAISIVIGLVVVFRSRNGTTPSSVTDGRKNDLTSSRDATLAALQALDMEKDKLSEADYQAQRQQLLRYGAAALRNLDEMAENSAVVPTQTDSTMPTDEQPTEDATNAAALTPLQILEQNRASMSDHEYKAARAALLSTSSSSISPQWQGAAWVLGILAVLGALIGILYLSGDIKPKEDRGASQQTANASRVGPDEQQWQDRLAANANDIEALNKLSWFEIQRRNNVEKATEYNERAKAIDSQNKDTRFNSALLLFMNRMPGMANAALDKLIEDHPDYAQALEFRGLFYIQEGQLEKGRALVAKAEEVTTDGASRLRLRRVLTQIDLRIESAKENDVVVVSGTIQANAADLKTITTNSVVYLSIRTPQGGPPIAAKMLPVGPFPLTFRVTGADRIAMGGAPRPIPDSFNLSIRVDRDGNPLTRDAELPLATLENITKGKEGLTVELTVPSPQ